jgi:transposase
MEVIWERSAGLDVHKDTVVVCARMQQGREVGHEVQRFGTMSRDLVALGDWLEG